jgi:3-hydroxyisobutyrate dehydrogenase
MQVGFIGLGIMGASMAANLQKAGYQLVVHDIRRDAAMPHLKAGAKWADSSKSVAAQSKVVFTSLPGQPEVEAVALGSNGPIEGMEQGNALVRSHHQLTDAHAQAAPALQRAGLQPA